MANLQFNSQFIPTASASTADPTVFTVTATINDVLGQYAAADVQLGDIVTLDCFNSSTNPKTVSRYRVTGTTSATGVTWTGTIHYIDTGATPQDPSEVLGTPGFIARSTPNNAFGWNPAPSLQGLPDYLTVYAQDSESLLITDNLGGGGLTRMNNSALAIPAKTAVYQLQDGSIGPATASGTYIQAFVLGFAQGAIAAGGSGNVLTSGDISGFSGLTPDTEYFLSNTTPGAIVPFSGLTSSAIYQTFVGISQNATTLSLHLERPLKY